MSVECEGEAPETRNEPSGKDGAPARARAFVAELRRGVATHFTSLRSKVVGLLTSIGAVLVAMSGIYVFTTFNQNLAHEADLRAGAARDVLIHAAARVQASGELEPILSAIGNAPYIAEAAIAGRDGTIAASSHAAWNGRSIAPVATTLADVAADRRRPLAIETQRQLTGAGAYDGDYAIWLDLPQSGEPAVAIVRVDMDRLAAQLTTKAWNTMTWLTITAILAVLTISMLVHRIVVAPIEALRDFARNYRRGTAEASQHGDEIGIVAQALAASSRRRRKARHGSPISPRPTG